MRDLCFWISGGEGPHDTVVGPTVIRTLGQYSVWLFERTYQFFGGFLILQRLTLYPHRLPCDRGNSSLYFWSMHHTQPRGPGRRRYKV